jgi:hypothetical protein
VLHIRNPSYGRQVLIWPTGTYHPPDCAFNRVIFNLTVTSAGRQFDRLALMFLGDIEVFRTSTAEPTQTGIVWSYVKDMSSYVSLLNAPQKIIFDLGNLVDDTYTGTWSTTLTATYFTTENTFEAADIVLPVSARRSAADKPSQFIVPGSSAVGTFSLPENARRAVFSISACGQAAEEFWWSNVFTSDTQAFGDDAALYGHAPFRELQLLIDGILAGVAWPFPVIFTGGVVPGFWRPIVGIDAFDLQEDQIDITPFIPLLKKGNDHTLEIRVVGIDDDGSGNGHLTETIESSWIVTGKLFVWLDTNSSVITGFGPVLYTPKPSIRMHSKAHRSPNGAVQSLEYSLQVFREVHISTLMRTSKGYETVSWRQNLAYSSYGTLTNGGNDQTVQHNTTGHHASSCGYSKTYAYPLWVSSTYQVHTNGDLAIDGEMLRGKDIQQFGDLAFPNQLKILGHNNLHSPFVTGTAEINWQNGTASYRSISTPRRSYGSGSTEQHYSLSGVDETCDTTDHDDTHVPKYNLYKRDILAVNGSVMYDHVRLGVQNMGPTSHVAVDGWTDGKAKDTFVGRTVKAVLGRGPG